MHNSPVIFNAAKHVLSSIPTGDDMFLHSPSPSPSRVASARSFPSDRCHFSVYRRVRQSTLRRIISRLRSAVRFVERARRFVFLPRCRVVSTTHTTLTLPRRFVFLSQRPFRGVAVGDTLFHTLATANTFFAAPRCWVWVSIKKEPPKGHFGGIIKHTINPSANS